MKRRPETGAGGDLRNGSSTSCRRESVASSSCVYGVESERGSGEECDRAAMMVLCLRTSDHQMITEMIALSRCDIDD